MPRHRPFHKRYHADFIHSVKAAGMSLEEVGAYDLILEHLNDRDHALPDDDRFLAGLLGCPLQRWRKIRARLIRLGKIVETGNNHITNPRFERERAERHMLAAEAAVHGREGGRRSAEARRQEELDFDEPSVRARTRTEPTRENPTKLQESSKKVATKLETISGKSDLTPSKTAIPSKGTLKPRARATQSLRVLDRDSTHPIESLPPARDRVDLMNRCCDIAGFRPATPNGIDYNLRIIEGWMEEGLDFENVVIPTLTRMVATSTEPIRTLGKFRSAVAHEHARQKAQGTLGRRYVAPPTPVLERDDEEPEMAELRHKLLQAMGVPTFCAFLHNARLAREDGTTLRVTGPNVSQYVGDTPWLTLKAIAARAGFERIWS